MLFPASRRLALSPKWTRDILWRRARAVPSLDLRFAENKSLVDATTGQNLVTFTRASSGTYVDSQGVIRTATTNLLLRSEEFETTWVPTNASIVTNTTTAPNGTNTADTLVENTATGGHVIIQSISSAPDNTAFTSSCYCKALSRSWVAVTVVGKDGSINRVWFNLSTGSQGATNGIVTGFSAVSVGNGWYRIAVTASSATGGGSIQIRISIGLADNTASYTGDGTSGIYLWGAQLEQSSTVGEYIPTTSTINSAPRFDHNPTTGESLGLLVEEQRTNSIRNNTMVGAVAGTPGTLPTNWSIPSTVNGLTRTIAGVGTINGINYIDVRFAGTATATANINYLNDSSNTAPALNGQTWTFSAWVSYTKTSGSDPIFRLEIDERDSSGNFLAATQTTITPGQTFVRYSATRTNNNALTAFELAYIQAAYVSGQSYDFTLRIGLPQLEQGAFATSVIPTTTAAATRSADVTSITGTNFSSWYRQDEGTVFASATTNARYAGSNTFPRIVSISDGTTSNRTELYYRVLSAYTDAGYSIAASSIAQAGFDTNNERNGQSMATAYATNNFAFAVGGSLANTDSSGTVPTVDRLSIGLRSGIDLPMNGTIRRLTYWPRRLSNEALQGITQ